jgi:hypothetical protein
MDIEAEAMVCNIKVQVTPASIEVETVPPPRIVSKKRRMRNVLVLCSQWDTIM